ncbi:MAG: aminopeptidase P family protein [Candidatus Latescibacteria bacterium]|nr:aminopeptidase P family protein [Candidatus Latescibacterota bacterium]
MLDLSTTQTFLRDHQLDAWLVCDFRNSNPVMWQLLGFQRPTTRRAFLLLPAQDPPRLLAHAIEQGSFEGAGVALESYTSWQQLHTWLQQALAGCQRVAMEYSPSGALPITSWVDGGTLDLVRSCGVEVVSSADLFQASLATWSSAALASHLDACRQVAEVKDTAFAHLGQCLQQGRACTEYDLQQFMLADFARRGLETDHGPIVAFNAHSGNPHYEPQPAGSSSIARGDWVLLDLWARHPGNQHVFGDLTWVACAGPRPTAEQQRIFDMVKRARDLVMEHLQRCWTRGAPVQGWEADRVARDYLNRAGYGDQFLHRTGHSLGPGRAVHGLGANLDDLESHDTRLLLPGTGFSVEPGIYLPQFGVRLEINVYVDPEKGPQVTTPAQEEIVEIC